MTILIDMRDKVLLWKTKSGAHDTCHAAICQLKNQGYHVMIVANIYGINSL